MNKNEGKKKIRNLLQFHEYFKIIYALILASDNEIFEKLLTFLYDQTSSKLFPFKKEQNGLILLLMCIQYHSVKDKSNIPQEYFKLENILKISHHITKKLKCFDETNSKKYIEYVTLLIKLFLTTGILLYWEKESENDINVYYYNNEDLLIKENESICKHYKKCSIKRKRNDDKFTLYIGNKNFVLPEFRTIKDNPTPSFFETPYKSIAYTIMLFEKDYCPFCNPKKSKNTSKTKGCKSCSDIKSFISEHRPIAESIIRNELRKINHDELLQTVRGKGKYLKKQLEFIKEKYKKSEDNEIKNKIIEIQELIDKTYILK